MANISVSWSSMCKDKNHSSFPLVCEMVRFWGLLWRLDIEMQKNDTQGASFYAKCGRHDVHLVQGKEQLMVVSTIALPTGEVPADLRILNRAGATAMKANHPSVRPSSRSRQSITIPLKWGHIWTRCAVGHASQYKRDNNKLDKALCRLSNVVFILRVFPDSSRMDP